MSFEQPPQEGYRAAEEPRGFGGLLKRQYRWGLTVQAKILLLLLTVALLAAAVLGIYPFLAATHRVKTDTLVVEGWVHKYAIRFAVGEYKMGNYKRVFTTGGPVTGNGGYVNDYQTAASVGADLLKDAGLPSEVLQMVPTHVIGRDRTYSSAVALRQWLRIHNAQVHSLNIVTEGAHARRSRLLFQEALGPDVNVGVIAVPSPDFDAKHWWHYSEGVQAIVEECLGYLYAKFLFYPRESDSAGQTNAAVGRIVPPASVPRLNLAANPGGK